MKWKKKGLLYTPQRKHSWDYYYGILPTPFLIEEKKCIRIYFATTNKDRIGYISYMDVASDNPAKIIQVSAEPLIGPGKPGTFDDCGGNPSSVLKVGDTILLYYAGYQRSFVSPYSIFSGLALSTDGGESFSRHSNVPILDRTNDEYFIRSAPTVIADGKQYRMWYVSATAWEKPSEGIFAGKMMPRYVIKHAHSIDGIRWNADPEVAINYHDDDEFGFGRPWVVKEKSMYRMWYSVRRKSISYRIGYAESHDGYQWIRKDHEAGIDVSSDGWDSEMVCYPAVITVNDRTFLFYNGNNNGETGFGWAELER